MSLLPCVYEPVLYDIKLYPFLSSSSFLAFGISVTDSDNSSSFLHLNFELK